MAPDKRLGGVNLPDGISWDNRWQAQGIAQSHVRTLGGKLITFEGDNLNGFPIVLTSNEEQGWFTSAQRDTFISMANVKSTTYLFEYREDNALTLVTKTVIFDHSRGPAIVLEPVQRLHTTIFIGQIRLLDIT